MNIETKNETKDKTNRLKIISLILLCLQNACFAMITRYLKVVSKLEFNESTTIFAMELLKLLFSIWMISKSIKLEQKTTLRQYLVSLLPGCIKMFVPASLYFVQNAFIFVGLHNLPSNIYTVFSQLKILTTAIFSVLMLNRKLISRKQRALLLLCVGVCLIQQSKVSLEIKTDEGENISTQNPSENLKENNIKKQNFWVGISAAIFVALLSGFSGIYFEKLLKQPSSNNNNNGSEKGSQTQKLPSIQDRNFQLALDTLFIIIIKLLIWDQKFIYENGFFYHQNFVILIQIFLNAFGGILVALVVSYADTIIKSFAVSGSIILTTIFGNLFLGDSFTFLDICGSLIVIISIFNYNEPDATIPSKNSSKVLDSKKIFVDTNINSKTNIKTDLHNVENGIIDMKIDKNLISIENRKKRDLYDEIQINENSEENEVWNSEKDPLLRRSNADV